MNLQDSRRPLTRNDLPAGLWSTRTKFRHGQCDPAGIVYTPKFFDLFNRVIEEWFDDVLGIPYQEVIGPRRTGLGYVSASATFFTPCMMGEEVDILVAVNKVGTKSYGLTLHALKDEQEALRGHFVTVTTGLDTHQSIEVPADIRDALLIYAKANTVLTD
ncbi:acyl-CoA thioesterase [Nioella sp.]|uniref:acyl-CoA thioesterase n=1 Tax=Nioella sp. TaxID=1912091 RepID=UPI003B526D24